MSLPHSPTPDARDAALDDLLPVVLAELRRLAHRQLARESAQQTLQTTDLVHEAYLRLRGHPAVATRGRAYFFASAARAMRQVLVDAARRRQAQKRTLAVAPGGEEAAVQAFGLELLALDDALDRLAQVRPRQARVVECRYFGGLTVEETGEALGIAPRTVKLDWAAARAWLWEALREDGG